jgi:hypothetical protein
MMAEKEVLIGAQERFDSTIYANLEDGYKNISGYLCTIFLRHTTEFYFVPSRFLGLKCMHIYSRILSSMAVV